MVWTKESDTAAFSPKVLAMGNAAYGALSRMFHWANQQRTDGWLPADLVRTIARPAELTKLVTVKANGRSTPLHKPGDDCTCLADRSWPAEGGYWLHDFLDQQPSRAENDVQRAKRKELGSKELRRLVRERDGNACRYCGIVSSWAVHRGPKALQVEHIDPRLADGLANLVVSCAACNLRKGKNTPEAAGMELLPPPVEVPKGGWKPGDEPTIERAWPVDQPTEPTDQTDDPTVDPIDGPHPVEPNDPTGDRPVIDYGGTSAPSASTPITDAIVGATAEASYLGPGGAGQPPGSPVGSQARSTRVGPAMTPRSALAPNPYLKGNTSNPSPAVVETMDRLGCSLAEAERVVAKTIGPRGSAPPARPP